MKGMFPEYDVIVVGAGHAGCEAACAAANMGSKTLLITMNMDRMAQMSCNPAMGGVAKGQIVREIDAMGGYSGIVSDLTAIQFRMLNKSKGPAMWSPRTQNDRSLFTLEWRKILETIPNLDFWQEMATGVLVKNGKVVGIKTGLGQEIISKTVILTNGTFLNGLIHIGEKRFGGGRSGEKSATGITECLIDLGFESGRMKTGTPARIDGRSLDYSKMEEQPGDENPGKFSFTDTKPLTKQRSCHITYTNPTVHEILETGFDRCPLFNGNIQGTGPRYCPSIEDKISRFKDRERHQIFVEPEGWDTVEIYVNGFSSSLPEEIQLEAMKHIEGFENVRMFRPGYAIEYDYFPPHQLHFTLETKEVENLYFAGQINGTTGYEEAGCQGMMAGINAHLKIRGEEPFILKRDEAYIGVLIDDLITKGTEEPYRMFTSRAEYRILLRQDNADVRLTEKAYKLGLAKEEAMRKLNEKKNRIEEIEHYFKTHSAEPNWVNEYLQEKNSSPLKQKVKLQSVLSRPQVNIQELIERIPKDSLKLNQEVLENQTDLESYEIAVKYSGYIEKEKEMAQKMHNLENVLLVDKLNYKEIHSLSSEAVEKLERIRPKTLGQASRISGISPSDISILMVHIGR